MREKKKEKEENIKEKRIACIKMDFLRERKKKSI